MVTSRKKEEKMINCVELKLKIQIVIGNYPTVWMFPTIVSKLQKPQFRKQDSNPLKPQFE